METEKVRAELDDVKKREKKRDEAASNAADHISLADAYWRWGRDKNKPELFDRAIEQFKAAIECEPENPNHYIKMSFVYADKAAREKDKAHYDKAIALTNEAIEHDKSSATKKATARAYYDRACYKQMSGLAASDVLSDLERAIKANPVMRDMARLDPDLDGLRQEAQYKKLVDTETVGADTKKVPETA